MNKTHGMNGTPTWQSWRCMLDRCRRSSATGFHNYGGRGIKVCKRWERFENFLEDMGIRPVNKTLERSKNDKDYSKENCIWATSKEQSRNKRNCRFITFNGETLTLAEWSERLGIHRNTLKNRINYGWSLEMVFKKNRDRFITHSGETHTITEWAMKTGINRKTLSDRLQRYGWSIERALTTLK